MLAVSCPISCTLFGQCCGSGMINFGSNFTTFKYKKVPNCFVALKVGSGSDPEPDPQSILDQNSIRPDPDP
jgi:hypothetical protein